MSGKDNYICANCVDDYAIKIFINRNVEEIECSYCGTESIEPIAAPFDSVADFTIEGIESQWTSPEDAGAIWDPEDGRWAFDGEIFSGYELAVYLLEESNDKFLEDLAYRIDDQEWCSIEYPLDPYHRALSDSWDYFCERVKHHTRYVFFQALDEKNRHGDPREIPPSQILDALAKYIEISHLVKPLVVDTIIYRARSGVHRTSQDLGPPPANFTQPNRMSPKGIPMFYGAFDKETALEEIDRPDETSIGIFKLIKPITILDLTKIEAVPSIFDPQKRDIIDIISFLKSFRDEISRAIPPNNQRDIEYIPTQVMTEYFRHVYRTQSGVRLGGIKYLSSRINGDCCVLFFENEHCCDDVNQDTPNAPKWLLLQDVKYITS
jgi:DNA-directed RNA polymerase subunit RPC12/RpoP